MIPEMQVTAFARAGNDIRGEGLDNDRECNE